MKTKKNFSSLSLFEFSSFYLSLLRYLISVIYWMDFELQTAPTPTTAPIFVHILARQFMLCMSHLNATVIGRFICSNIQAFHYFGLCKTKFEKKQQQTKIHTRKKKFPAIIIKTTQTIDTAFLNFVHSKWRGQFGVFKITTTTTTKCSLHSCDS